MSLGRMVGPSWAGFIFDTNMNYPYWSGSFIMLLGFFLSLGWLKGETRIPEQPVSETKPLL